MGSLTATQDVSPARAGSANTVTLTLLDAQNQALRSATVKLTVNMQVMDMGTTSATMTGDGTATFTASFAAGQTFTMAGGWLVQVEIDRPNQSPQHLTFSVMVLA